jgi:ATP-dependent DNA helicase RecG
MRSDLLSSLFTPIESLAGIGPKTRPLYTKLVGETAKGFLLTPPLRLIDRRFSPPLHQLQDGDIATLTVQVVDYQSSPPPGRFQKPRPLRVNCMTEEGAIDVVFFHAYPNYVQKQLPVGQDRIISGRVERFGQNLQMPHPDYIVAPNQRDSIPAIETVYPLTQGVSLKQYKKALVAVLDITPDLPEWIEATLLTTHHWRGWKETMLGLHHPQSEDDLHPNSPIISRLAFDELYAQALALQIMRKHHAKVEGQEINGDGNLRQALRENLPFTLTNGQEEALAEIYRDQAASPRMMRLLQGDVGSGKTVVALMAMLNAIESGKQAALMAPTEILAMQHHHWVSSFAELLGIRVELLTGKMTAKQKRDTVEAIHSGAVDIVIGTHALFQEKVSYHDLALVVIDEQHRFGVNQRSSLAEKGRNPDVLLMTATPIPRTLVMTIYGDMECSSLTDKPQGRKPIDTRLLSMEKSQQVAHSLERVIARNEKIYWVCPLIEESENEAVDLAAAEQRYQALSQLYPGKVGLVHGKMKTDAREQAMTRFKAGETMILVATTVIEVGVDIKEATTIIIEQAERFGLSQLHQLRGRVGRNALDAYCLLLYGKITETSLKRLSIMRESNDGFRLAEEDLRLRGSGEITGTRQSGLPNFHFADLREHYELVKLAHPQARSLIEADPYLKSPQGQAALLALYMFGYDALIGNIL